MDHRDERTWVRAREKASHVSHAGTPADAEGTRAWRWSPRRRATAEDQTSGTPDGIAVASLPFVLGDPSRPSEGNEAQEGTQSTATHRPGQHPEAELMGNGTRVTSDGLTALWAKP
jgi:hypothetical protein